MPSRGGQKASGHHGWDPRDSFRHPSPHDGVSPYAIRSGQLAAEMQPVCIRPRSLLAIGKKAPRCRPVAAAELVMPPSHGERVNEVVGR